MLLLRDSPKLLDLFKSLARSIPESLKVYGSIYHINHGNAFNMEVLVDTWPEYQTVIIRPQKQEMTDDKNQYINTYSIFSKEPQKLQEILENYEVINWKQILQIQGCQESLGEGIRRAAFLKSVKVKYDDALLFITKDILKFTVSNNTKLESWGETGHPEEEYGSGDPNFKFSPLDISHSGLVNDSWKLGQNEKSLLYIQRCIQTQPAYCLLGPEGHPVTWAILQPTSEMGVAYTLDGYRRRGILKQLVAHYLKFLRQKNMPFYLSVVKENEAALRFVTQFGFFEASCGWHRWTCYPQTSSLTG
ncbi:glycine N-acyltransferase-like protein 1 [Trichechus inunguis]|uniref:Glycine N-acyltransferase-like protein n=1 Tax=Trichechus manatus latirostris TaxID=127582 RepID=A0A2Y9E958_TRIMA|nr:glycine N-acyltransferase-like protein 1 [Trichechus manatus latirostris]